MGKTPYFVIGGVILLSLLMIGVMVLTGHAPRALTLPLLIALWPLYLPPVLILAFTIYVLRNRIALARITKLALQPNLTDEQIARGRRIATSVLDRGPRGFDIDREPRLIDAVIKPGPLRAECLRLLVRGARNARAFSAITCGLADWPEEVYPDIMQFASPSSNQALAYAKILLPRSSPETANRLLNELFITVATPEEPIAEWLEVLRPYTAHIRESAAVHTGYSKKKYARYLEQFAVFEKS